MKFIKKSIPTPYTRILSGISKATRVLLCLSLILSIGGCTGNTKSAASSSDLQADPSQKDISESDYFSVKDLDLYEEQDGETEFVIAVVPSTDRVGIFIQVSSLTRTPEVSTDYAKTGSDEDEYYDPGYSFQNILMIYDLSGNLLTQTVLESVEDLEGQVMCAAPEEDGKFSCIIWNFDPEEYTGTFSLLTYDTEGCLSGEPRQLTGLDESFYPTSMVIDSSGNICTSASGIIYVFNHDGSLKCSILNPNSGGELFLLDGKVYTQTYISEDMTGGSSSGLCPVDIVSESLGEPVKIDGAYDKSFYFCNGKLYTDNSYGLYLLDLNTMNKTEVLLWKNTDILTAGRMNQFYMLSGDAILCLSTNYSTEITTASLLSREAKNPNNGKQILQVAGISVAGDNILQEAVIAFNRQNENYRIEIKDYDMEFDFSGYPDTAEGFNQAYRKMNSQIYMEILSGTGPDMLYESGTISLSAYKARGLLVDLNTLISEDSSFCREDYIECVLDLSETDGHLYTMPVGFCISGLLGRTSVVGDRSSWTVDEFKEMAGSLSDGTRPIYSSHSGLLWQVLTYSMDSFVDRAAGTVHFDTEEFYQLLDYASTFGVDDDLEYELTDVPEACLKKGEIALLEAVVRGPADYTAHQNYLGEAISIAGYPSTEQNGPVCCASSILAVTTESSNKDGCWEFVKMFLSEDIQQMIAGEVYDTTIPVLKTQFEKQIERAVNPNLVEYPYDALYGEETKPMTDDQVKKYRSLVDGLNTYASSDDEILSIILEEVPAYFAGQKSPEEVAMLIQDKVQILVDEQ